MYSESESFRNVEVLKLTYVTHGFYCTNRAFSPGSFHVLFIFTTIFIIYTIDPERGGFGKILPEVMIFPK